MHQLGGGGVGAHILGCSIVLFLAAGLVVNKSPFLQCTGSLRKKNVHECFFIKSRFRLDLLSTRNFVQVSLMGPVQFVAWKEAGWRAESPCRARCTGS